VNVWAPFRITQKFIPLLKKHNSKNKIKSRVINITSWAGILSQPLNFAYNISKFGIIGLTEAMYYDLGLLDIHVVDASPGVTKTPLLKKTTDSAAVYADLPEEGKVFYKKYVDYLDEMSSSSNDSNFLLTPEKIALMGGFVRRFLPFSWRVAMIKQMYNFK